MVICRPPEGWHLVCMAKNRFISKDLYNQYIHRQRTPFVAICRPPNGRKFGKHGHNHNNSWRITYPVRTPHIKCIQWSFLQIMIGNTRWATLCPTIRLKSGQFGQKSYKFWQFIQSVYTQCMERIECSQYSREWSEKNNCGNFFGHQRTEM